MRELRTRNMERVCNGCVGHALLGQSLRRNRYLTGGWASKSALQPYRSEHSCMPHVYRKVLHVYNDLASQVLTLNPIK
jgi:hypothetical protein